MPDHPVPSAWFTRLPLRIRREGLLTAVLATLVVAIAFGGSLGGAFVYDDHHQIVGNPLVHAPDAVRQALTSDVWAFKDADDTAGSNYWRPIFILWLIANSRVWGIDDPFGWHVTSLLLHTLACVAGYALLRVLRVRRALASCAIVLFAIHPTRVEAVSWISSSHDPLCAALLFTTLAFAALAAEQPNRRRQFTAAALACYVVALGTKEIALLFPGVVATELWLTGDAIRSGNAGRSNGSGDGSVTGNSTGSADPTRPSRSDLARRLRRVIAGTLPFAVLAVIYALLRYRILGYWTVRNPWAPEPAAVALSIPETLAFYIRQSFWPAQLGPLYPLRTVGIDSGVAASWSTVGAPLVLLVALGLAVIALARRDHRILIGVAFGLSTLGPVLNVGAFHPERIVQDRYLYLPFFGLAMVVVLGVDVVVRRATAWPAARRDRFIVAATVLVGLPMLILTVRYGRVWSSDLALWERGVATDPGSAFAWSQYGASLVQAGRLAEARDAAERSLAIQPRTDAMLLRTDVAIREQRWSDAEADLQTVISGYPDTVEAYERLAVVLQNSGRLPEAITLMTAARDRLMPVRCRLTTQLAVLLYQAGEPGRAQVELEAIRGHAAGERNALCREGLFRLGQLYRDAGREADARAAFAEFLALTVGFNDAATRDLRELAEGWIAP